MFVVVMFYLSHVLVLLHQLALTEQKGTGRLGDAVEQGGEV